MYVDNPKRYDAFQKNELSQEDLEKISRASDQEEAYQEVLALKKRKEAVPRAKVGG